MSKKTYKFKKTETHFVVPCIKSVQGGKIFYATNLPMRYVIKLVPPIDIYATVEERAQRVLSKNRAEKIAQYIEENPDNYTLPALTVTLLKTGLRMTKFEPIAEGEDIGELYIPCDQQCLISDGQHRLQAIRSILESAPSKLNDSIALTIYDDIEHSHAKQIFTDINLNASKPSGSINSLYDSRNCWNALAVSVSKKARILQGRTEYEKPACTKKSHKTFPLKSVVNFCRLSRHHEPDTENFDDAVDSIVRTLDSLHDSIHHWFQITQTTETQDREAARTDKEAKSSVQFAREYSIAVSALALEALAVYMREGMSQDFLKNPHEKIESRDKLAAEKISQIDWGKDSEIWNGRCLRAGKLIKNKTSITLVANALLTFAGYNLSFDMERVEHDFLAAGI